MHRTREGRAVAARARPVPGALGRRFTFYSAIMIPEAFVPRFEFATAGRVIFGWNTLEEVGKIALECGRRALVVTGRDPARAARLVQLLEAAGLSTTTFGVAGEPSTGTIEEGVGLARAESCELVVGFGGGSAIDAAKAISALLTNPGELMDYLEVIGRAQPLARPAAPCIAIPTTAGTGAEVTRNSVLSAVDHGVKVSLRSPFMLPRVALVDPALTVSLPPAVTASTGMDALTQLIEPYTCCRPNPCVDALCLEGLRRAARALPRACADGASREAREDMALASLLGGFALANAGLGAVHGFAGPLGGMFPVPHGVVCAALLAPVMEANLRALRDRQPDSPVLARYATVAECLTGRTGATPEDGVRWVAAVSRQLGIPGLSAGGIGAADFPELVEKAARASSMKANPLPLSTAELTAILTAAL